MLGTDIGTKCDGWDTSNLHIPIMAVEICLAITSLMRFDVGAILNQDSSRHAAQHLVQLIQARFPQLE